MEARIDDFERDTAPDHEVRAEVLSEHPPAPIPITTTPMSSPFATRSKSARLDDAP